MWIKARLYALVSVSMTYHEISACSPIIAVPMSITSESGCAGTSRNVVVPWDP